MKISIAWLNEYLDRPVTADEAADALSRVGFPVEHREQVGSDAVLEVEVTSNRGDVLSHLGTAREVAAAMGRSVKPPSFELPASIETGPAIETVTSIDNRDHDRCPYYSARIITGVKVGPSPGWLKQRVESIGLRSINNVADVTNFVLHETGHPSHAFDLNQFTDKRVVIRAASKGEPFIALDQSKHALREHMLVIADAQKPQCLAGVMGGLTSEVTGQTTDVLLEVAVFDALGTRKTARGLRIASDSSYRYERGVDAAQSEAVSKRIAALVVQVAGGQVCKGVLVAGKPLPTPRKLTLRPTRCDALLGVTLPKDQQAEILNRLHLQARIKGDVIEVTVPAFRGDLEREVDLIEEVARLYGLQNLPVAEKLPVVVRPMQDAVKGRRVLSRVLVAHGYHETITFSFTTCGNGQPFLEGGNEEVMIGDERRKAEPMLRPGVVPSLLQCRKVNQDAGNHGVKLFETASCWQRVKGATREKPVLAMLCDAESPEQALRSLRGTLEELVESLGGRSALSSMQVTPSDDARLSVGASVSIANKPIGWYGLLSDKLQQTFDLQGKVVVGEFELGALLSLYPPGRVASALPRFPGIERDLSVVVADAVPWAQIEIAVCDTQPAMLESLRFVGTYRGKPIDKGSKSVTFRMLFRDPARTLRHDEVDPQVHAVIDRLKQDVGAQLR
jgi:phenylalanyl-tRNA synthetase beta chain